MQKLKPFKNLPPDVVRGLEYVLFDIDDTITTGGRLPADSFVALWNLHYAGLKLIPVTGRPAGWCDMIIRQWPVDAVIGENGAFCFYQKTGTYGVLTHPNARKGSKEALDAVKKACLDAVPDARVAKDQFARMYDLSIDFCEDEPQLDLEVAYKIRDICKSFGAKAKVSSIHVNTWFGDYDKLSMAERMFAEIFDDTDYNNKSIFFGDSPNDEPMFGFFKNSCAVANIMPFLDKLEQMPAYVADNESAAGFCEIVNLILAIKEDSK